MYYAHSAKNVSNWPKFTSSMNINCHMGHPLVTINNYYHVQFMIASISTIRASSARSIHYLNITSVCIWGSGMHQIFFTHKRQPRIVCLLQKRIHYTPLNQYVGSILLVIVWAGWHWKFVTCCENRVFEMVEIMSSFFKSRVKTSPSKLSKLRNKAMNILWDWLNHTI